MKGSLIVGINEYPGSARLHGCVNDAEAMGLLLETNGDESKNFHVEIKRNVQTRAELRAMIIKLFKADLDTALFYFAGHGCINERGGFFVTPDFKNYDEGISMDEVLNIVNQSKIREKIIIIDCCHAGVLGTPVIVGGTISYLGEGVTILTATRNSESSIEVNGHGVFTSLLLSALNGGAADITGNITPGAVYAYIDRSLGFWEQRPLFKTNISRFSPLRSTKPVISIESLRKITKYFESPEELFHLDPSYEDTSSTEIAHSSTGLFAKSENVAAFKDLQRFQSLGLVVPVDAQFMYNAAMESKSCRLTALGYHYWMLVKEKRI